MLYHICLIRLEGFDLKIWKLDADVNNFDNITVVNEEDWDILDKCEGSSVIKCWNPLNLEYIENKKKGDCPGLTSRLPILSKAALDILKPLILDSVEILPVSLNGGEFYGINVIQVLDCIDYEKSQVKKFPNSERIMRFIKYSFKKDCVNNAHIFKIKDELGNSPFISDDFRNIIINSNLKGFLFEEVWSDD